MPTMKVSIDFKGQSPDQIRVLWYKLNHVKDNLEKRLNTGFLLQIDPIQEKFYLAPIEESFTFHFPIAYSVGKEIEYV